MSGAFTHRAGCFNPAAGGGPVATYTTLDPGESNGTGITLSGGNLTATKNGTTNGAVAIALHGKSSGKWFYEVTMTANPGTGVDVGIVSARFLGYGSAFSASTTTAKGLNSNGNFVNGDVVRVIVDLDNNKLWFRINGTLTGGNPQTNTGGTDISGVEKSVHPAAQMITASSAMTFNFGASAWASADETGFTGWDDTAHPVTEATWRSVVMLVRSVGFFAQAFAEWEVMASSGGANILSGATITASHSLVGGSGALSTLVDGNTTTWAGVATSGSQNQTPVWFMADKGSSGSRNATHLAIRGRDGGGGAQNQAPTAFSAMVTTDNTVFWKIGTGYSFTAFAATTPGERKELTL